MSDLQRKVEAVLCPACAAVPGRPCRDVEDGTRWHIDRITDALAGPSIGDEYQHERAMTALEAVRAAHRLGIPQSKAIVNRALACACKKCLASNAALAAELIRAGVMDENGDLL